MSYKYSGPQQTAKNIMENVIYRAVCILLILFLPFLFFLTIAELYYLSL